MPLGVDPEAVISYPVLLVTALVQGLQVTQDICVADHVSLATAQDDRGTVPVQQLVDQNAHSLVTTDPTARGVYKEASTLGLTMIVLEDLDLWLLRSPR